MNELKTSHPIPWSH